MDEVLQMRRDTNEATAGMEDHYYLHDDLYNVLALADAGGNVVERYAYGDYGAPTITSPAGTAHPDPDHSAYDNPFLFNGRQYDETTGFYYYRTRYMELLMGRFISRDTIGLWGDANNLGNPYTYVGNKPWSRLDPFGEERYAPTEIEKDFANIRYQQQVKDVAVGRAYELNRDVALTAAEMAAEEAIFLPVTVVTGGANHVVDPALSLAKKTVTRKGFVQGAKDAIAWGAELPGRAWRAIRGGGDEALRAGAISGELYDKLRAKTPTQEMRNLVSLDWSNPPIEGWADWALPGERLFKAPQIDHIVPMETITKLDGFERLSFEQQLRVLNNENNFMLLSESANQSKGSKSFAEWTQHVGKGIPVNPELGSAGMKLERENIQMLQEQIYQLLRGGN